ncbi:MAG: pyridoxal phosphate-dependent aminotransferase [Acidimicrobiia bacterium]
MDLLSKRISAIPESETLAITTRAAQMRAEGIDVIGFGAGEPDFPTPPHIVAAAVEACFDPSSHKYSPTAGLGELRAAVAESVMEAQGVEPAQVLVTNGAKHAVVTALMALVDEGDEVLIPAPYWVTYPEAARIAGGTPIVVPWDTAFKVTPERLDRAATPRTTALVFASPSNPTGAVYTSDEVASIGAWAAERGIWVISDEIYDHLVYPPATFTSVAVGSDPERTLLVGGVSKTYAMTGWRVGWVIGQADVIRACTNLQSHTTSNVNNVAQRAALAALRGDQTPVGEMREVFDQRRRLIVRRLSDISGLTVNEPEGAFYAFPDVTGVLGRAVGPWTPTTSYELVEALLDQALIAAVPGEAFGAPGFVRFSYALSDEALSEGMDRLAKALI